MNPLVLGILYFLLLTPVLFLKKFGQDDKSNRDNERSDDSLLVKKQIENKFNFDDQFFMFDYSKIFFFRLQKKLFLFPLVLVLSS